MSVLPESLSWSPERESSALCTLHRPPDYTQCTAVWSPVTGLHLTLDLPIFICLLCSDFISFSIYGFTLGQEIVYFLIFLKPIYLIASPHHSVLGCYFNLSHSWSSCRTRTPGKFLWTSVTRTPPWSLGYQLCFSVLCLQALESRQDQEPRNPLPESKSSHTTPNFTFHHPQSSHLSLQDTQHNFLNALRPLKIEIKGSVLPVTSAFCPHWGKVRTWLPTWVREDKE